MNVRLKSDSGTVPLRSFQHKSMFLRDSGNKDAGTSGGADTCPSKLADITIPLITSASTNTRAQTLRTSTADVASTHTRRVRRPSVDGMLPESWLSFKSNILHQAVVSYNDAMNVQTRPRPTKTATANSERKADTPHA